MTVNYTTGQAQKIAVYTYVGKRILAAIEEMTIGFGQKRINATTQLIREKSGASSAAIIKWLKRFKEDGIILADIREASKFYTIEILVEDAKPLKLNNPAFSVDEVALVRLIARGLEIACRELEFTGTK